MPQPPNLIHFPGSRDGKGAADHDEPYRFGRRPRANAPYPLAPLQRGFSTREYGRLLILRRRFLDRYEMGPETDTSPRPPAAA